MPMRSRSELVNQVLRGEGLRFHGLWQAMNVAGGGAIAAMTPDTVIEHELPAEQLAQLCQISKAEAIGAIATGIVHDFNNLLTPMIAIMDQMQQDYDHNSVRNAHRIETALACAERAQQLVRRILNFARMTPPRKTSIRIEDLLAGMSEIFVSSLPRGVFLQLDLREDLPFVCADRNQLEAALLNLVINARDAMPEGGKITIAAAEEIFLPGSEDDAGAKRMVHLSVNDTGCGMNEMTLRRAVEPFFSTKEIGIGTGLGLSMACAVTRQLGGHFSIASQVGIGTTIDLWLPVPDG
jgi:signal transduction histidine kinase